MDPVLALVQLLEATHDQDVDEHANGPWAVPLDRAPWELVEAVLVVAVVVVVGVVAAVALVLVVLVIVGVVEVVAVV